MILYTFQCHSPKSSHPLPFPQSPKDCSIQQCLFCCLTYGVVVTIFLNSIICVSILYWCFSFWLISLCIIGSSFIHLIRTDSCRYRKAFWRSKGRGRCHLIVSDAIQSSHPLLSPSPPAPNPSQHQSLFQ